MRPPRRVRFGSLRSKPRAFGIRHSETKPASSTLLNRGFYGGIAHIAFRDQAIQNLDGHFANDAKAARGSGRRAETDTGGDRGDIKDNLAHRNPTRPCSVFGAIEE